MEAIGAFAEDPDVKFILTERDPDKWVKSVNNTVANVVKIGSSFPYAILKHFDTHWYRFLDLMQLMYLTLSDGTNPGDPGNEAALRRNYIELYVASLNVSNTW